MLRRMLLNSICNEKGLNEQANLFEKRCKTSRKIFVKKEKQKQTNKKTHLQLRNYFLAKHVLVWSPFFV